LDEEVLDYNKKIETLDNFINYICQLNAKSMPFDYTNISLIPVDYEVNYKKIKM